MSFVRDPIFWIVAMPLVAMFALCIRRVGWPYRGDRPDA